MQQNQDVVNRCPSFIALPIDNFTSEKFWRIYYAKLQVLRQKVEEEVLCP